MRLAQKQHDSAKILSWHFTPEHGRVWLKHVLYLNVKDKLNKKLYFSSSYVALQPISGLGLLFMRFLNLTLIDSWYDSLDQWSARRKAATYTGQHKHRINADKHPCL
jgi:hypothetical protein